MKMAMIPLLFLWAVERLPRWLREALFAIYLNLPSD